MTKRNGGSGDENGPGEYHGSVHVLAVANVTVYKPIESDVIIHAENLHIRVKISLNPQLTRRLVSVTGLHL